MALTYETIQAKLGEKFGADTLGFEETYGMLAVTVSAKEALKLMQFLYDDEAMRFRFLTDIAAVHYPERSGEELCVVYHLHNFKENVRLRVKAYVPIAQPDIFTATRLFPGANWMERETYDYFGVNFVGHPNLTRILNVDEMDYFPMRKEYPMEDASRRDKDDEMFGRGGSSNY
jgi:NADH-quinone oxidoreductase subunit C